MSGRGWDIFAGIRRVVVFILGILIIVHGLLSPEHLLGELILGAVMIGVLPIEDVLQLRHLRLTTNGKRQDKDNGR